MWIIKLIGVLFIVCSTTAVGINGSLKLRGRIDALQWYMIGITSVANGIRANTGEIAEIVKKLYLSEKYLTVKSPFAVELKKTDLTKNDERILSEFFSGLGMGDSESQIKRCKTYYDIISNCKRDAEKDYAEKGKLYKSLGFFAGLGIAVIII